MNDIIKPIVVLTSVCLIAASLLGAAYLVTADKIVQQQDSILKESLNQVQPEADDFLEKQGYYEALKDGQLIGYAAVTEAQGYSSIIKILVGLDLDKKVTEIRIIDQQETPGLGANAVKPEFYTQFNGLSKDDLALKKDNGKIDAITSATITSSAVTEAVKELIISGMGKRIGIDAVTTPTPISDNNESN